MAKDHPQESLDRLQQTLERQGLPPVVLLHGPEDHFRALGLQAVLAHAGDRDVIHLDDAFAASPACLEAVYLSARAYEKAGNDRAAYLAYRTFPKTEVVFQISSFGVHEGTKQVQQFALGIPAFSLFKHDQRFVVRGRFERLVSPLDHVRGQRRHQRQQHRHRHDHNDRPERRARLGPGRQQ